MPATTYPGTVTPLRGLAAFGESERDVMFGRDGERDELAKLITSEGFRAGLLYGEPGVGKTSLLRAGLVPHLRDHGVIALPCDDLTDPARAFAAAANAATGLAPSDGERPINFLARIVSQALAGQLYVFILDDVDVIFGRDDDAIVQQLGDLFARVVTRSGGRARFLFSCASSRVHRFGGLERRTGSLFPPSSRFELQRFTTPTAATVLERTIALAGLPADRSVAHAVAEELGRWGPVLPADLQIATLALADLGISSVDQLRAIGGATELERTWMSRVAESTGNERAGLRLLAELAASDGTVPVAPAWAASRAGIDRDFAHAAMQTLSSRGVVLPVVGDDGAPHYVLAHEILAPRIREIAAPARATARRAFELLGSKAAQGKRLSVREWLAVRSEGLSPASPAERAVLDGTTRFFKIVAAAVAGGIVALLLVIYFAMSGRYYLDVARSIDGRTERVVVRAGRPALSAFAWLPGSPAFGSIVADTGVTRAMIDPARWAAIADHDLAGELGGDGYADQVAAALTAEHRAIVDYATTGDEVHLELFANGDATTDEKVARFEALAPIARGGPQEIALVEQGLADDAPAVQTAALNVAAAAARRSPGAYREVIASALTSADAELRHLAVSGVRAFDRDEANKILQAALARDADPAARAELLAAVATGAGDGLDPSSIIAVLSDGGASTTNRKRARRLLRRAFADDPPAAARASIQLVSDHGAPEQNRLLALELIDELAPESVYADLAPALELAIQATSEKVKAAAWPLFARMSPKDAAIELVGLNQRLDTLSETMRVAVALGWGELARAKEPAAGAALAPLLDDRDPDVRAAAARAYGNIGRSAQSDLAELVKKERFEVAVGAAWGLANSVEVGAPTSAAVGGIGQLWKKKGRARRRAVEVYARIAKTKPSAVLSYISAAAIGKDDEGLKPLGIEGLCNALAAGSTSAARALRRSATDPATEVRRLVAECMVDNDDLGKAVAPLAASMADDSDPSIRADAARVLAKVAAAKQSSSAAANLVKLAGDEDRAVRVIATRGLAGLGNDAPDGAAGALKQAFERADEGEKLELLAAARAIGVSELVPMGLADGSPVVRIKALDAAVGTGDKVGSAFNAALGDADANVRRAALALLATGESGVGADDLGRALALATRDPDPSIAAQAMTTFARIGEPDAVHTRLERDLASPSEAVRARAAAACVGLAARDAATAVALLEPVLDDPARDVRVAMLPALATAYAATKSADELAALLRGSERHATRRLAAAGALIAQDGGNGASRQPLEAVAKSDAPLARRTARLALGLIDGNADGITFLGRLVR